MWRLLLILLLFTGCVDVGAYDSALEQQQAQISALQSEIEALKQDNVKLDTELEQVRELYKLEVAKGKCPELRDFTGYWELCDFLAKDKTNEIPYSFPNFVCYHYATTLVKNAMRDGYLIYIYIQEEVRPNIDHTKCAARMGNVLYFIEPQTDIISTSP